LSAEAISGEKEIATLRIRFARNDKGVMQNNNQYRNPKIKSQNDKSKCKNLKKEAARIRSCLIYRACIGAISPSVIARLTLVSRSNPGDCRALSFTIPLKIRGIKGVMSNIRVSIEIFSFS